MYQGKFETVTILAGADLSAAQHKVVIVAGTIAADSITAIGLLQNKPDASGKHATIGYVGQMKAYAGAGISQGASVMVTTSGFLITTTSGSINSGKALAAANSGDLFPGVFNFVNGGQNLA